MKRMVSNGVTLSIESKYPRRSTPFHVVKLQAGFVIARFWLADGRYQYLLGADPIVHTMPVNVGGFERAVAYIVNRYQELSKGSTAPNPLRLATLAPRPIEEAVRGVSIS